MADATTKTVLPNSGTPPFAAFEWILARRYLRARRKEGFISVIAGFSFLGIMLGVATLIIVMAVMNGFRQELLSKILGLNGHATVLAVGQPLIDYDRVTEKLRNLPRVTYAMPYVQGQTMASTPAKATGTLVRGLREADIKALEIISSNIQFGTLEGFDQSPGLVIGTELANALRVRVGDKITLVSPRGANTPFGTTPRVKNYPVKAVFEIGMREYDGSVVFMPLQEAQRYFNRRNRVDAIEVMVDNPDEMAEIRPALEEAAGPTMAVRDWRQLHSTFFGALKTEQNVMFLILTLIVLVAALNIISGLIMLVKDKSRDIAVLRTMGATRGSIMRVFFITGASIGVVGTLAGLLLGLLVCFNIETIQTTIETLTNTKVFPSEIYYLAHIPAKIDFWDVIQVTGLALSLSFLATLYPSWRAAKLDPVEAIRYE